MTTLSQPDPLPIPAIAPKTILPIRYAVIVQRMDEGPPQQLAAVQFRIDGHVQATGAVKAHAALYIAAMQAAAREIFADEVTATFTEALSDNP